MSNAESPGRISASAARPTDAIQPNAPDFIETPEVPPLSDETGAAAASGSISSAALRFSSPAVPSPASASSAATCSTRGPAAVSGSSGSTAAEAPLTPDRAWARKSTAAIAPIVTRPAAGPARNLSAAGRFRMGARLQSSGSAASCSRALRPAHGQGRPPTARSVMPAQEAALYAEKIADIMTYIRGSWGNTAGAGHDRRSQRRQDQIHCADLRPTAKPDCSAVAPHGPDPTDKK